LGSSAIDIESRACRSQEIPSSPRNAAKCAAMKSSESATDAGMPSTTFVVVAWEAAAGVVVGFVVTGGTFGMGGTGGGRLACMTYCVAIMHIAASRARQLVPNHHRWTSPAVNVPMTLPLLRVQNAD
jgi:hypothetical protein